MKRIVNWPRLGAAPVLLSVLAITSCKVGPTYEKPTAAAPETYKEIDGWKLAEPADDADRGPWWTVFNDPVLSDLEAQVNVSNQNLKLAEATYRQAYALLRGARAGMFPTIGVNAALRRTSSGGQSLGTGAPIAGGFGQAVPRTFYSLTSALTWEIDVWGRIRRTIEAAASEAEASSADLASARLSAQATLAMTYFQLRSADEQKRLYDAAAETYQRSAKIANDQYNAGVASKGDVAAAEAQLANARSNSIAVSVTRAQLEHAIAILVGKPPAEFSIAVTEMPQYVPEIPIWIPASLVERRPDVAAAERRMQEANANIGVAIAAYFPTLSLTGSYGYQTSMLGNLLDTASRFWSIGPALSETVIDFGRRSANVEAARQVYEQNVASYRQTVLTALQQVEDQLIALKLYADQLEVQKKAVDAARDAERISLNQYKAGTIGYTTVIQNQQLALNNEQAQLAVLQNQFVSAVTLIQALGGGWDNTHIKDASDHDITDPDDDKNHPDQRTAADKALDVHVADEAKNSGD